MAKGNDPAFWMVPPHSVDAEKSVLGAFLIDNEVFADMQGALVSDDFYQERNRQIFQAMVDLQSQNHPIDLITLEGKLKEWNTFDEIGGIEYITEIANKTPTAANAKYYANIVKNDSTRRKLIKTAEILREAYNDSDVESIIAKADQAISAIEDGAKSSLSSMTDIMTGCLEELDRRYQNKGKVSGLETGFVDLDYKTGGLQDGDLILIAGRPSMGKTSLAENIAAYVAINLRQPVAFFSMEMSKRQIGFRMLSSRAKVNNNKIKIGDLEDRDWEKINEFMPIVTNSPIVIDDSKRLKPSEIRAKCRRIKAQYGGLRLIVIDHLTEMWRPMKGNDFAEHSENVREVKRIAAEFKCPVILLQQLSRKVEGRQDKRPMLSDLRETGVAEEVADVILLVYRDEYYNPNTDKKNLAEIIIGKGRDSGVGTIELAWLSQYTKFGNLERHRW